MAFVAPAPGRLQPAGGAGGRASAPRGGATALGAGGSPFVGLPHRRDGGAPARGATAPSPRPVLAAAGGARMATGGGGGKPSRPGTASGAGGGDYAAFDALLDATVVDADVAAAASSGAAPGEPTLQKPQKGSWQSGEGPAKGGSRKGKACGGGRGNERDDGEGKERGEDWDREECGGGVTGG